MENTPSRNRHAARGSPARLYRPAGKRKVLINRVEEEAMGAGELSMTLSPAAIGNAIFGATGERRREIPFTSARVLEALKAGTYLSCRWPETCRPSTRHP
jgi:hypothetical protein